MTTPRCSIITYHHDPAYLLKIWKYLNQPESPNSWEWIIGYTTDHAGNASWERIKQLSSDILNISLLQIPQGEKKASGYFLNACAEEAKGELLVFLFDNALPNSELIPKLVLLENTPDFFYGDFAFYNAGKPIKDKIFKEPWWETYIHSEPEDGEYLAYTAPPIGARTLYEPKLAPKGVLIWRQEIFRTLRGFNPKLGEGCDYELLCRTYVAGHNMAYVPDFCFSYIEYDENLDEAPAIYANIGHQYFYHLINEEIRQRELPKLSLCISPLKISKDHKLIEWTGAQLLDPETCNAIPENSVGLINASDFLHLIPQNQIIILMEAIWKILIPGGWFISTTPSTRGAGAFSDPRQASYWNSLSFSFFCLAKENELDFGFSGLFQHVRVWETFPSAWHKDNGVPYVQADLMKLKINL